MHEGRGLEEIGQAMLDAFIIEEIKRRERVREERERPVVELPLPHPGQPPHSRSRPEPEEERQPSRGVIVIDLSA